LFFFHFITPAYWTVPYMAIAGTLLIIVAGLLTLGIKKIFNPIENPMIHGQSEG